MSYEDYGRTARHYDTSRAAVGCEIVLGLLARHLDRPAEALVLDAGCGTGNYARALVGHVGAVIGLDLEPAMLAHAREKLRGSGGGGGEMLVRAAIDAIPLARAGVDAVTINQVLHHLPDDPLAGRPVLRRVCEELGRVVRPGGVVVVNVCSHEQIRHGYWYAPLTPEAVEAMVERHVPLDELEEILGANGLEPVGRFAPLDVAMQGERYLDGLALLDPAWRAGDSMWALLTEPELARVEQRVRSLEAEGELAAFVARHDARRRAIGQLTFVCARRR